MRVLIAEDEPVLANQIKAVLSSEGLAVDIAPDGAEAQFLGETEPYDMIILDIGLPIKDGLTVLKGWRSAGIDTPVLLLTARNDWTDRVDGWMRALTIMSPSRSTWPNFRRGSAR